MNLRTQLALLFLFLPYAALCAEPAGQPPEQLVRLKYNHPGLVVDLGVGLWAWPVPADADGDGDWDLLVVCPDKPYGGVYLFENPGGDAQSPVFKPARRLSHAAFNVTPSYLPPAADKRQPPPLPQLRVLTPGKEYPDFLRTGLAQPAPLALPANPHPNKLRFNQWRLVDYDGDGDLDLTIGIEDWTDYGWDRAFNERGEWTRGPLRGLIYLRENQGDDRTPQWAEPRLLRQGKDGAGPPVETFGCPSQNFVDFDGDGDLDLLCGEFLDGFTYFENTGTRAQPNWAAGRRLPIAMELEMLVATAVDWDRDGDVDLIVGQEDGRVAFVENAGGLKDGLPNLLPPRFLRQEADDLKYGVLCTPVGYDWDGDGDEDLVSGNSAGFIGWLENLGGDPPRWAAPQHLQAGGETIRIQAGPSGSIQGPAEAKWGYTTLSVADWDHDGLPDLIVNSIWGKVVWYRNTGARTAPRLAPAQPIHVTWNGPTPKPAWNWWNPAGAELVTQWRTTPVVADWNADGLADLAMLDPAGYFSLYARRKGERGLELLPPQRLFFGETGGTYDRGGALTDKTPGPLRLNAEEAGRSGRRKLAAADWDGDGLLDLLANSKNASLLRATERSAERIAFRDEGLLDGRVLAGHDTSPTTVDWNRDGLRDLVVGAEDGCFYYLRRTK